MVTGDETGLASQLMSTPPLPTQPIVSLTYENERISIKKQLTLLKMCVTSLLCGPRADLWPFYGFLCKPLYREKTVDIKTNKTAINRPVDHTGET